MRRKIIAGNWKMNKTPSEAVALVNELKDLVKNDEVDVVYCVPAIDIVPVAEAVKGTNVKVGAENMYYEENGAYTGEIAGITPILCCGETLEQREMGIAVDFIRLQIKSDLKDVAAADVAKLVIAYEPIWAIGTGKTATSDQAEEICKAVRDCVREMYDDDTAEKVRIQYGGSVNAGNAAELFTKPNIDGALVGGASLKADFGKIVNYK